MNTNLKRLRLAFGFTIKQLRKQHGLSQTELAHRSEIDRSYLSALESGSRNIALNNIYQLATAFGLPPSALLAIVESNFNDAKVFQADEEVEVVEVEEQSSSQIQKDYGPQKDLSTARD